MNLLLILEQIITFEQSLVILDVGAYHGDFSDKIRAMYKNSRAYLFEPDINSYQYLVQKYAGEEAISVHNIALGANDGQQSFHVNDSFGYKSSLIKQSCNCNDEITCYTVEVRKLDSILPMIFGEQSMGENKSILKIDAQGTDLSVLLGAEDYITKIKPVVQVEIIFEEIYQNQNKWLDIFYWFDQRGYKLAILDDVHKNDREIISFCDAVFLSLNDIKKIKNSSKEYNESFSLFIPSLWQEEFSIYKQAAEERLELIHELDEECKKRLAIIEQQTQHIEYLNSVVQKLSSRER